MGLLSSGTPLEWDQVAKYVDHVHYHGIVQLLETIHRFQHRENDKLLWGDEIEYMVVTFGEDKAMLSLRQDEILGALMTGSNSENVCYHQEYGRYMIEATPKVPFSENLETLVELEANLDLRRDLARSFLASGEHLLTIASYPLLGVGHFADTDDKVEGPATKSLFLPDKIINLHPRFPTLSSNIRQRRGKKIAISIPVFKDTETKFPWTDPLTTCRPAGIDPNSIYMDAMGFGMGCCCLQLTFQGANMDQARDLYDALAPLTPIMLALSAASPIFRGILADQDVRWNVVSASVDDRTDEEKKYQPKSRYDSIDCYISRRNAVLHRNLDFYNDITVTTNKKAVAQLEEAGMGNDPLLLQHFAHLFTRDPLVIFQELIDQDDSVSTDHFENIQTTNWQTMRFKPPPSSGVGWRAEFRPMEIQFTDFENAAYCVFTILMSRVILKENLCLYQPISQVDQNMKMAHKRDPIFCAKFWFRTSLHNQTADSDPKFMLLSLNEIINGGPNFTGLVSLINNFLDSSNLETNIRKRIDKYVQLISQRASGELKTNAQWIRDFVKAHPDYKHDSVVSEKINYDLLVAIESITRNKNLESLKNTNKL